MPSLVSTIVTLGLVAGASAHVSLINIFGSNDVIGHAFGVNLFGKYPRRMGEPGDAGGDAGIFQINTDNPNPPCGGTPELGHLDVHSWMSQAEERGLPAAYSNMSVVIEVFQVNRDGGGPMNCEFNEDATATSWQPMTMTLNQAGNFGLQNQNRVNETVVATFPPDAACKGGYTQTACIVRCRTGVNKRFGGCFAVKLFGAPTFAEEVDSTAGGVVDSPFISRIVEQGSGQAISNKDMMTMAQGILSIMKQQGLVVSASATGGHPSNSCQPAAAGPDGSNSSAALPIEDKSVANAAPSNGQTTRPDSEDIHLSAVRPVISNASSMRHNAAKPDTKPAHQIEKPKVSSPSKSIKQTSNSPSSKTNPVKHHSAAHVIHQGKANVLSVMRPKPTTRRPSIKTNKCLPVSPKAKAKHGISA